MMRCKIKGCKQGAGAKKIVCSNSKCNIEVHKECLVLLKGKTNIPKEFDEVVCSKRCYNALIKERTKAEEDKNKQRRNRWHNDGTEASKNKSSIEVLLDWLTKEGNYDRWRGSGPNNNRGETKRAVCTEISGLIKAAGIDIPRKWEDVWGKIAYLEKTYKEARYNRRGTGYGTRDGSSLRKKLKKEFIYYDVLSPIFENRPSVKPLYSTDDLEAASTTSSVIVGKTSRGRYYRGGRYNNGGIDDDSNTTKERNNNDDGGNDSDNEDEENGKNDNDDDSSKTKKKDDKTESGEDDDDENGGDEEYDDDSDDGGGKIAAEENSSSREGDEAVNDNKGNGNGDKAGTSNNSTNNSVSSVGGASDDDDVLNKRIRPSCVAINRKRKQQQDNNLSSLTMLKSEHFQLEYKLKKTQTEAAVKKVLLEERVAEATIRKMEEDARSLAMDTRIKVLRECDRLKNKRGMFDENLDRYLPLD